MSHCIKGELQESLFPSNLANLFASTLLYTGNLGPMKLDFTHLLSYLLEHYISVGCSSQSCPTNCSSGRGIMLTALCLCLYFNFYCHYYGIRYPVSREN